MVNLSFRNKQFIVEPNNEKTVSNCGCFQIPMEITTSTQLSPEKRFNYEIPLSKLRQYFQKAVTGFQRNVRVLFLRDKLEQSLNATAAQKVKKNSSPQNIEVFIQFWE